MTTVTITRLRTALGCALIAGALVSTAVQVTAQTGQLPDLPSDVEVQSLTEDVFDPTAIDVTPDGRVVFTERTGRVKVYVDGETIEAGRLEVAANQCPDCPDDSFEEGGLHGILVHPDFATNGRIYLYYSVPNSRDEKTKEGIFRLSTFVLSPNNELDLASEEIILENPAEWDFCCHYGGDLDLMPDGTIIMSVGDDTSPRDEGWNPRDMRPDREAFNAERTSQNTADRRGKLLRFHLDGTPPADNPFVDEPGYDPLVYAMGFRSNYRIGVDPETGTVYVGNVGPDAYVPDSNRGPRGHDEFEVVPPGGGTNHGWPRCIANNQAYQDYDYAAGTSNGALSCDGMVPAAIYYPYDLAPTFPLMLTGSRSAIAGPVYRYDGDGELALPDRFQGQALLFEWSRDIAMAVPVNDDGSLDPSGMSHVSRSMRHPIDAAIGPDGAVYVAEYGEFFYNNNTSRISRIKCTGCTDGAGPPDPRPSDSEEPTPVPSSSDHGPGPSDGPTSPPASESPSPDPSGSPTPTVGGTG